MRPAAYFAQARSRDRVFELRSRRGLLRLALLVGLVSALLALGACRGSREPAEQMLTDIDIALMAAGPDAIKYLPEQIADLQSKLAALHAAFDRHDYAAVIDGAPAVLAQARGLASAAAARKAAVQRRLVEQWSALSAAVTSDLPQLQRRVEFLGAKAHRKQAAALDLSGARAELGSCESLWSKAQGAFGNGNLGEAVDAASQVKQRLESLAPRLQVELAPLPRAPMGSPAPATAR